MPRLVQLLGSDDHPAVQLEAAWALSNIASGNPEQTAVVVGHGVIPEFIKLVSSSHIKVQEQATWGLGNIVGDSKEFRDVALSHGAMDELITICSVNDMQTQKQIDLQRIIAWTLSNFCRKPHPEWRFTQKVIQALKILWTLTMKRY